MARYIDDNVIVGVNLGLMAIMLLPISAMLCASFWLARRSKDPARVAFTYLKVTLTLAFLYVQSLAQEKGTLGHLAVVLDGLKAGFISDFGFK